MFLMQSEIVNVILLNKIMTFATAKRIDTLNQLC